MIITQTPLRVSLLGGNTDFPKYYKKYGGAVLTMAIDKYVYCIITKRFDDEIRINWSIKEKVNSVSEIKHEIVREAMRMVGVDKGVEITFLSDVPGEGSGLGSSSGVAVGVLNALHLYKGEQIGAKQLAEEACNLEIDILKKPIGVQDQYIAAFGGLNLIQFGKEVSVCPIITDFTRLEASTMLFYTGITRKSIDILSKMKLDKKILDRNKEMALEGKKLLEKGDLLSLGGLVDEYWKLKKKLNGAVTNQLIDGLYSRAIDYGAWGGKITGAGGGGFLLTMSYSERRNAIREHLGCRELIFKISPTGSRAIFNI
jgi:D-glycero-alpha-D-manno-heptose-7-phosphate kinase